jgi:hypothetical protein
MAINILLNFSNTYAEKSSSRTKSNWRQHILIRYVHRHLSLVGRVYYTGAYLLSGGEISFEHLNDCCKLRQGIGLLFRPLSAAQLRDLNFPKWAVRVFSVPFITLILPPMLSGVSGARWENDYGIAPSETCMLFKLAAVGLSVCAALFTYVALVSYRVVQLSAL